MNAQQQGKETPVSLKRPRSRSPSPFRASPSAKSARTDSGTKLSVMFIALSPYGDGPSFMFYYNPDDARVQRLVDALVSLEVLEKKTSIPLIRSLLDWLRSGLTVAQVAARKGLTVAQVAARKDLMQSKRARKHHLDSVLTDAYVTIGDEGRENDRFTDVDEDAESRCWPAPVSHGVFTYAVDF
jgi:hypothetical protein